MTGPSGFPSRDLCRKCARWRNRALRAGSEHHPVPLEPTPFRCNIIELTLVIYTGFSINTRDWAQWA